MKVPESIRAVAGDDRPIPRPDIIVNGPALCRIVDDPVYVIMASDSALYRLRMPHSSANFVPAFTLPENVGRLFRSGSLPGGAALVEVRLNPVFFTASMHGWGVILDPFVTDDGYVDGSLIQSVGVEGGAADPGGES